METLLIVLGAALALGGQWLSEYRRDRQHRRAILVALEEEMDATSFGFVDDEQRIDGFTSQAFDQLYLEITRLLTPDLARAISRYHFEMKLVTGGKMEWVEEDHRNDAVNRLRAMRNSIVAVIQREQGAGRARELELAEEIIET